MEKVLGLKCRECARKYPKEPLHVCEFCFGPLEVDYNYEVIKKSISRSSIERGPASLWRYADLLPIDGEPTDGLNSGFTPLHPCEKSGRPPWCQRTVHQRRHCLSPDAFV